MITAKSTELSSHSNVTVTVRDFRNGINQLTTGIVAIGTVAYIL